MPRNVEVYRRETIAEVQKLINGLRTLPESKDRDAHIAAFEALQEATRNADPDYIKIMLVLDLDE